MSIATKHIGLADKFAVSASTVCAVHCIGLPFLLSVFPAIGTTFFGEESLSRSWLAHINFEFNDFILSSCIQVIPKIKVISFLDQILVSIEF